jgi:HEAT repeat protein
MVQAPVEGRYWAAADIPALIAALIQKDAAVRRRAREDLIAVGRPAIDVLLELLHDRRAHVRWEAAKALSGIGDPRAAPALVQVLEEDDEFDVRWVAGEGLIAMGHSGLRPLLAALAARPGSPTLQEGAHHVCHELAKRRAFRLVGPVLAALRGSEPALALPAAARAALAELLALPQSAL